MSSKVIEADQDFRRAIRARYFSAFLSPRPLGVLACGILLNLVFRLWAFDLLSERFGWYRSMSGVILGLSVDFYLLCLVNLTHGTFDTYRTSGIYRDLHVASVKPWNVFGPFVQVLTVLIVADTAIEALAAGLAGHEPLGLAVLGFAMTMLYALVAAVFFACILIAMNLKSIPLLFQFFVTLGLSFAALLAVTTMGDLLEPALRTSNQQTTNSFVVNAVAKIAGVSWQNFSVNYSYYIALVAEGIVLALISAPLYLYVRRIAERRFASL